MPAKEKTTTEEIRDDVKHILKILNGNGHIGICAKVNILWGSGVFVVGAIVTVLIKVFIL